ncbi:MAG: hypothetical protein P1U85_21140 [Verrucomicrobiales bacterium]|nr:hypothetical protein [Verrucomicrobiales bacterium]
MSINEIEVSKCEPTPNLRKQLEKLFGDRVYFRDDKRNNGITERFKDFNKKVWCLIFCEEFNDVLYYNTCYSGNAEFQRLVDEYALYQDWVDACVACLGYW